MVPAAAQSSIVGRRLLLMALPVHRVEWSVHASGVADISVIADALTWLIGNEKLLEIEKTQSFHGPPMYILRADADKKSTARQAFPRVGAQLMKKLGSSLAERIDDENWLHLRLDLDELVCGRVVLAGTRDKAECVKGRVKLEIYPNDKTEDVATRLLVEASEIAERKGFPEFAITDVNNE